MELQTRCFTCKCKFHVEITTFLLPDRHVIRLQEDGSSSVLVCFEAKW